MPTISIVAPAYNESSNISAFLASCNDVYQASCGLVEVLIINDCSTDNTLELLEELKKRYVFLRIFTTKSNIGCHPATLYGFSLASSEWLVFLPTDNQISPSIIFAAIPLLETNDMIVTHRSQRADSSIRKILSRAYNIILRGITNMSIRDFDSSIFLRRSVFNIIHPKLTTNNVIFAAELALRVKLAGLSISEMTIPHSPRLHGKAGGINIRDLISLPYHLFCLFYIRFGRL